MSLEPDRILEFVAVTAGVLSVWYSRKRSIFVYPFGLLSVLIYVYLCAVNGLYADAGINVFYTVMSLYGWWRWASGAFDNEKVVILKNSPLKNGIYILFSLCAWYILYLLLVRYTNSTVPVPDSFVTALSITGMILMAEKRIENWLYWFVVDAVSIPLFISKGLYLSAFQFFVFCLLAVAGYFEWKKQRIP